MKQIKRSLKWRLYRNKLFRSIAKWYKTATLPGFQGVPIRFVVRQFGEELKQDRIGPRASAISFNFMLALFPTLIFVFSLIPVIPIDGLQRTIFELMQNLLPDEAFNLFRSTIEDTISQKRVDLLSFGFIAMIFFATNGVNAILKTFAKINPAFKQRNFFREWLVALMLTVMLSLLVIISVALIVGGSPLIENALSDLHTNNQIIVTVLKALQWIIIMGIYFFGLSIIYYFAPALKTKWRFISVGATVATVLSMLASVGFSYYVNNFAAYNKFYGSLGIFIVVMSWIYINSLVLLFGFELNNSIRLNRLDIESQEEFEEMMEEVINQQN